MLAFINYKRKQISIRKVLCQSVIEKLQEIKLSMSKVQIMKRQESIEKVITPEDSNVQRGDGR